MKYTVNYESRGKLRTDCTSRVKIHLRTIPFRILKLPTKRMKLLRKFNERFRETLQLSGQNVLMLRVLMFLITVALYIAGKVCHLFYFTVIYSHLPYRMTFVSKDIILQLFISCVTYLLT